MSMDSIQPASGATIQTLAQGLAITSNQIETKKANLAAASQKIQKSDDDLKALFSQTSAGSTLQLNNNTRANILQLL